MFTLMTSNQIKTMRHIKSYRSCPTSTSLSIMGVDRGRMLKEEGGLTHRQAQRRWLADCWGRRPQCCR